jgi:hypothetical protein
MRRLIGTRKFDDASRYAKTYDTVDDAEFRTMQSGVDKRLDDAALAKAKAQAKKEGVRIGMTKQEVLDSSWGKPTSVNATTTARGTREQWVYGDYRRGYLYFDGDILTSIQN